MPARPRLFRHFIAALCSALILACSFSPARADQQQPGPDGSLYFYAPSAFEDTPLSHIQGVITSYRVGDRYGEIEIVDGLNRPLRFIMGGDLTVEGRTLNCQEAPAPDEDVNTTTCPDWPRDIILGRTLVTLTYWQNQFNNKPILVVSKISVTRGAFVP